MRRILLSLTSLLFVVLGSLACAQTIPNVPDIARDVLYNVTSSTTNFDVPFELYGDCTDLTVKVADVRQTSGYTCISKSGTAFANVPRPVTDAQVQFTTPILTGTVEIIGARHPRWGMGSSPGITRKEFNQTVGNIVSTQRETYDGMNALSAGLPTPANPLIWTRNIFTRLSTADQIGIANRDGVDRTTALQSALNALGTGDVELSDGLYVGTLVTSGAQNIVCRGQLGGAGVTITAPATANAPTLRFNGQGEVDGCNVLSPASATQTAAVPILVNNANSVIVRNSFLFGGYYNIAINNVSFYFKLLHSQLSSPYKRFIDTGGAPITGCMVGGVDACPGIDVTLTSNLFLGCVTCDYGASFDTLGSAKLTDNTISSSTFSNAAVYFDRPTTGFGGIQSVNNVYEAGNAGAGAIVLGNPTGRTFNGFYSAADVANGGTGPALSCVNSSRTEIMGGNMASTSTGGSFQMPASSTCTNFAVFGTSFDTDNGAKVPVQSAATATLSGGFHGVIWAGSAAFADFTATPAGNIAYLDVFGGSLGTQSGLANQVKIPSTSIAGTRLVLPLAVGSGGTGAVTAAAARASLGAAASGANGDITSLTGLTTALPATEGGTGQLGGYTVGDILYATAAGTLGKLADVATGNVLRSGGVAGAPAYGKVNLSTDLDANTVPAANTAALTGDITKTAGANNTVYTNVVPAAKGGAGTITGALRGSGAGVVTQAACADLSNGAASCSTDTTNAANIGSGTLPNARLATAASSWTPADASGAGLTLSASDTKYQKIGNVCTVIGSITYPTTANGAVVQISGIPAACQTSGLTATAFAGGSPSFTTYSASPFTILIDSTGNIQLLTFGGTNITNANFSAKVMRFSLTFPVL